MKKNKCQGNCKSCPHLFEEVTDDYTGTTPLSYHYCELGHEVNFLNTDMETIENKLFAVLRQLNTLIGYILPKGNRIHDICKKAGLDVATCKKLIKVLSRDGYLEVTGKAAGTKYKMLKKVDVDTTSVVNSILSYKEKVNKPSKKETRGFVVSQTPKTYQIGQKVYTLCHNKIVEGHITSMKITDVERLDKVTNNLIEYQLLLADGTNKGYATCNIYQFSDTVDGLLSLLKYEYERSK